jgi:predicted metal-dependent peptidase
MGPELRQGPSAGNRAAAAGCGVRTTARPTAGSSPPGDPNEDLLGATSESENYRAPGQDSAEMEACARAVGQGSSAIARLLAPSPSRSRWERVLRHGLNLATLKLSREHTTYAKRNRRQAPDTVLLPGWTSAVPRITLVIDVSGSVDRAWVRLILAEAQKILATKPTARVYLVTHTSQVCWEGWIVGPGARSVDALELATAHTGGTRVEPAYEACARQGRFDVLIHFTDCEVSTWPEAPAAKWVIGAVGPGVDCPASELPRRAEAIPCTGGEP